ncbi:MAG: hypothetical protein CVT98_01190 [Bacteroidetes bacterium HGW-Bacteroidetes-15]|nr:MAG: hypothetical protein CVT98_01190 [Bacteroidetes bacterium HGW-Bacteroidetes-15]
MQITRSNYESYFIDYLDGHLSHTEVEFLFQFLENNPDLASEIEGLNTVVLEPSLQQFSFKEGLKKTKQKQPEDIDRFDYLCIAELEEELTDSEQNELETISKTDATYQRTRSMYKKLILRPDSNLVFERKSNLFRIGVFNLSPRALRNITSLAAGLGLLIGVFSLFTNLPMSDNLQLAIDEKRVESEVPNFSIEKESNEDKIPVLEELKTNIINDVRPNRKAQTEIVQENQETTIEEERDKFDVEPITPIDIITFNVDLIAEGLSPIELSFYEQGIFLKEVNQTKTSRTIGVFELAQLGINRLASATGGNIRLDADKNEEGMIKKIHFETNLFALSVPVNRKQ